MDILSLKAKGRAKKLKKKQPRYGLEDSAFGPFAYAFEAMQEMCNIKGNCDDPPTKNRLKIKVINKIQKVPYSIFPAF